MNNINLKELNYIIENVEGFSLLEYCKLMKTLYTLVEVYVRENNLHPVLEKYMIDNWNDFEEITITEAFKEENQEKKRIYFFCLKPERIFKKIKSNLISEITLERTGLKNEKKYSYNDTYKLFEIDPNELGITTNNFNIMKKLNYVQCTCNSTGREYYIWVDKTYKYSSYDEYDAIDAICWTLRTPVKKDAVECFYRQGDVLITKVKDKYIKDNIRYLNPEWEGLRNLTRDEYINKLILQS